MELKGNKYGTHRVIEPQGVLPQPATVVNNNMDLLYDNEIRIDVDILNIDSASFTQIKEQANGNISRIKSIIKNIVAQHGKLKNPVTGSGGMLIGTVEKIGSAIQQQSDIKVGDRIATLVSLSLTPLKIDEIIEVKPEIDQIKVSAKAILFESGIYAKLPADISETLSLAVLDVCGAPAQTQRLVKKDDTVVVIGAGGKSGMLCCAAAKEIVGDKGLIIGIDYNDENISRLKKVDVCHQVIKLNASHALQCYQSIKELTSGSMADVVINNVNIPNTEMGSILMCKDRGTVYFFSMATSFTKSALGAEGIGKDVDMLIGNGYAAGHAQLALDIIRRNEKIRTLYEELYT
ncbi:L-erythro-3,5-diaminohexanoate dehydrogenase [Plebeiibacterium sediminum]|uniref:L-erythro-3,5-diaminohexanoate dehydrogenase n=1 Tax=Plebeiibacterium sediminum TaxID=2992112 RepID=A0AAE3M792_9BACT|nr:L-erythro-3,5-diaminohexanoate dehydrogenase [Plebeiobacterium sediminum]MCW3788120.1 L-erythro-3,5-diaminohexanoate dehydrogenase [Plebeiobacterium sediminum]